MTPFAPDHAPRLRLRLREILADRGISWLKLPTLSGGRISRSTAHRLVRERDTLKMFDAAVLEALCDVLNVTPCELLERDTPPAAPKKRAPRTQA
jgi:DNA-binding Xre family transcriptional regulator